MLSIDDELNSSPDSFNEIKGYFLGKKVPYRLMKRAMALHGKGPICVYMALWVLYSATRRRKIILMERANIQIRSRRRKKKSWTAMMKTTIRR